MGLGDMLPPTVRAVNVFKDGAKIHALRARDPNTGRIGYFDAEMLKQNVYSYVPVLTGDEVEVAKTVKPGSPEAQRYTLMEHVAVYKDNAMEADAGMETLYTNKGDYVGQEEHVNRSTIARGQRQNVQRQIDGQPQSPIAYSGKLIEIEGQKFPQLTRRHLEQYWGVKESQTSRLLSPVEFLGQRIMVNRYVIPFLIEAEARMKERGVHYEAHESAEGCQCYSHRGIKKLDGSISNVLSKHSWGIALDINPGEHPFGTRYKDLDKNKRMPIEFVRIMEECGFRWGNEFRNADPMHFEFAVYPPNARGILKNSKAKAAFDAVMKESNMPKMASTASRQKEKSSTRSREAVSESGDTTVGLKGEALVRNPQFRKRVKEIAANIGCQPEDLITIFHFESGGINPQAQNKIGATGLIQWIPSVAKSLYGLHVNQIRAMSALQQLDLVEKYFKKTGRNMNIDDLYLSVLYPYAKNQPDDFILGSQNGGQSGAQKFANYNPFNGKDSSGEARLVIKKDVLKWIRGLRKTSMIVELHRHNNEAILHALLLFIFGCGKRIMHHSKVELREKRITIKCRGNFCRIKSMKIFML